MNSDRIDVRHWNDLCLVVIHGEIDLSNADSIAQTIFSSIPNSSAGLVVDLSNVRYLDSAGVNLLFHVFDRLRQRQQQVRLVVPVDNVLQDIILASQISAIIPVYPSLEEAAATLPRGGRTEEARLESPPDRTTFRR